MAKRLLVKVNEADNVAIAVKEIKVGTQVSEDLVTRQDIPQAHKVALERIPKGQPVIRYGVILGYALEDIEKGDWINEFMLEDRKSTRLNSSHRSQSRMPSSA